MIIGCSLIALTTMFQVTSMPKETQDPRVRSYVTPVRVVATSETGVSHAERLLGDKFGQVPDAPAGAPWGTDLQGVGSWMILDFGRELHGGVQLGIGTSDARGMKVRLRFGESVSESCSDADAPGGTASNDHALRDMVVQVPLYGVLEVGNTGYRFLRIDLAEGEKVAFAFVRAVALMRPMAAIGAFRSSDERLNRIFDTAVRTVHLCCQDYLWDGIKRDRLVWMGDTHPETRTILPVFGAASVLPDSLDYMAATTAPTGWMNNMPTYTLWWIRNLAEWYRFTGDVAYLRKHEEYLVRTFAHVREGMKGGEWLAGTFLDWPTHDKPEAERAGTQGLALLTARDTEMLAEALGNAVLRFQAQEMAETLERCARRSHPADGKADGPCAPLPKSAAAMLALSGLRTSREMFDTVLGRDGHAGVSTFYGYYMLEAMSAAGEQQRALDTVRDYWGGMLDVGATSFWEDFDLAWTNNCFRIDELPVAGKKDIHGDYGNYCYKGFRHSLCHGWSAGPAAWCFRRVLGIEILEPGCKRLRIRPDLGDLEWAEGEMALPTGETIKVRACRKGPGAPEVEITRPQWVAVE